MAMPKVCLEERKALVFLLRFRVRKEEDYTVNEREAR
jgi:hypothetical protein